MLIEVEYGSLKMLRVLLRLLFFIYESSMASIYCTFIFSSNEDSNVSLRK